jgi:hypothetical protein
LYLVSRPGGERVAGRRGQVAPACDSAATVQALREALSAESPANTCRPRALLEVGLQYLDDDTEERLTQLERRVRTFDADSTMSAASKTRNQSSRREGELLVRAH